MDDEDLPPYRDSNLAAVKLLKGAVYSSDQPAWGLTKTHRGELQAFFSRLGLRLVVDENDGFAYLRQLEDEEMDLEGYEQLPRLVNRKPLTYEQTLLAIIMRDELRRFDGVMTDSVRCIVPAEQLYEAYRDFFSAAGDEKKVRDKFNSALNKLEQFGFVKKITPEPAEYEIRPILKARFTLERLAEVREKLAAHFGGKNDG
ncbi:MAG: DUF4194 domain-containing protein [Verrucomicrobiales bacterium]|nr:DUF4194 domain-containing protein [Verrucomicrobiales bacterium]